MKYHEKNLLGKKNSYQADRYCENTTKPFCVYTIQNGFKKKTKRLLFDIHVHFDYTRPMFRRILIARLIKCIVICNYKRSRYISKNFCDNASPKQKTNQTKNIERSTNAHQSLRPREFKFLKSLKLNYHVNAGRY